MAADHDHFGGHFHHIALLKVLDGLASAVLTNELEVGLTQGARPLVGIATVRVSLYAGVSHESHVAEAFVETPERARVAVKVLALRTRTIVGSFRVATQAQRARVRLERVVVVVERAGHARTAKVLAGHLGYVTVGHEQLLYLNEIVDGHMPTGHVAKRRSAGPFCTQIPQVGGQVGSLHHGHGIVDGLFGHGAVVFGGQWHQAEVTTGPVRVGRIERYQIGQTIFDHVHAFPSAVGAYAVQIRLDVATGEGVFHQAAFVFFEVRYHTPTNQTQWTFVQFQDFVAVVFSLTKYNINLFR